MEAREEYRFCVELAIRVDATIMTYRSPSLRISAPVEYMRPAIAGEQGFMQRMQATGSVILPLYGKGPSQGSLIPGISRDTQIGICHRLLLP